MRAAFATAEFYLFGGSISMLRTGSLIQRLPCGAAQRTGWPVTDAMMS